MKNVDEHDVDLEVAAEKPENNEKEEKKVEKTERT